jgi:hypothetical protein
VKLYAGGRLDENDITPLDTLRGDITDAYAKGKLTDQHYTLLNAKISL